MTNFKKIFAVVLALVIITVVFSACSNDKTLMAASFLAGDWETTISADKFDVPLVVTFNADGTATMNLPDDKYNQLINDMVDTILHEEGFYDLSDDEKKIAFEEMGVADMEEAKIVFFNMLTDEIPYEELKADFETDGTWQLEVDTLTMYFDGDVYTCETDLSKGEKSFTAVFNEKEIKFTKM